MSSFHDAVEEHAKGAGSAWEALEALTGSDADWWPDDVPVLIAELDGGEGRTPDSGLRLDVDRVLLRVVGYGGRAVSAAQYRPFACATCGTASAPSTCCAT